MRRIYFDHAATTPVDSRVKEAMDAYMEYEYGNPSALYQEGLLARQAVDTARSTISRTLAVKADEIYFTGSGTESDNLAVVGVIKHFTSNNPTIVPHVITSVIEHPAVLQTIQEMEKQNVIEATYIPVDSEGFIQAKGVQEALKETTILVSIMQANSEIGTIQPIHDVVKIVRDFRKKKGINKDTVGYPYVHTDACQAFNYVDSHLQKLGVDLYTFNGSKIYGPKGVGVLYIRTGVSILPIVYGGSQERGLRAGTENVPGIVGVSVAATIASGMRQEESARLILLRDYFIDEVMKKIPSAELNGGREQRLPNNINISIPDVEQDMVVIELDAKGIACSSKSACKSSDANESHVVRALGKSGESLNTVRFSLGRATEQEDIDTTVLALIAFLDKMKQLH